MFLKNLKDLADKFLDQKTTECTIVLPECFNSKQKLAVKTAAELIGLKVQRLLNTSTAIANQLQPAKLPYREENKLLFINFGGGSLGMEMIQATLDPELLEVHGANGDPHLGGIDFDQQLVDFCAKQFEEETGLDCRGDAKAMRRLQQECEKCKIALSQESKASIEVIQLMDGKDFTYCMTREQFDSLCSKLVDKFVKEIVRGVKEARGSRLDDLDELIMVGGTFNIRAVQEKIEELFKGKKYECKIKADEESSVKGAARVAYDEFDASRRGLICVGATGFNFGIEMYDGLVNDIGRRSTSIPTAWSKQYSNSREN